MTIALIHYLQFVCVNCDVHVYKTGIRRAMKKKIIKHTWRTIYTCICFGQCNLISKCKTGSKPHPPAVMIIFLGSKNLPLQLKLCTLSNGQKLTRCLHGYKKEPFISCFSSVLLYLFHNKLSNTYLHLIIDTCKKKMHVND